MKLCFSPLAFTFLFCLGQTAPAEPVLQQNDRLAICGDGMTGDSGYSIYIEDHLLMNQPIAGLDIAQFGWCAGDPAGFLARLDPCLLPFKPTVVLTSFNSGDVNTRAKVQTDLVEALKNAGVRTIVIGSPKCVDSYAYQNDPVKAAAENQRLGALAAIDKGVAAKEGVIYADVFGATMAGVAKAKALRGKSCVLESDRDVFNMAIASAYLKALGCDGNIGTITIDFAAGKAEGTPGQRIVSIQGGMATVNSTVPSFWFPGHNIAPTDPRPDPLLKCIPFNEELNRYMLVVKNLPTAQTKVYWDDENRNFSSEELARGVNLAKEIPGDHPFGEVTTNVNSGVYAQQHQEQIAGEALVRGKADPQADARREALLQAAKKRVFPVKATIRIQPLAPAGVAAYEPPPKIILDTDLGGDVDDDGALAVLNKLADEGKCEILACVGSSLDADRASAAAIDAINTYYGRPNLPIGMYQGDAYGKTRFKSRYTAALRDEFPHTAKPDDQQPSSLEVYRKTLAAAPDKSVKIVSIGFLINLEDLLKSPPDVDSPLSGMELVKKKVKELVVMGGAYPQGGEWNFGGAGSGPHTQYVTENWPTPILFSGFEIGGAIITDTKLASAPVRDPVRRAYELQDRFGGHQSWDLTAVLAAVEDPTLYWDVGCGGYCRVAPSGADQWNATPDRADSYLIEKAPPADIAKVLDGFLAMPPKTP